MWITARYSDIAEALKQPGRFSNAGRFSAYLDALPAEAAPIISRPTEAERTGVFRRSDKDWLSRDLFTGVHAPPDSSPPCSPCWEMMLWCMILMDSASFGSL